MEFVMYQTIQESDGSFRMIRIEPCEKCGSMLPVNTHWQRIHDEWHARVHEFATYDRTPLAELVRSLAQ